MLIFYVYSFTKSIKCKYNSLSCYFVLNMGEKPVQRSNCKSNLVISKTKFTKSIFRLISTKCEKIFKVKPQSQSHEMMPIKLLSLIVQSQWRCHFPHCQRGMWLK